MILRDDDKVYIQRMFKILQIVTDILIPKQRVLILNGILANVWEPLRPGVPGISSKSDHGAMGAMRLHATFTGPCLHIIRLRDNRLVQTIRFRSRPDKGLLNRCRFPYNCCVRSSVLFHCDRGRVLNYLFVLISENYFRLRLFD